MTRPTGDCSFPLDAREATSYQDVLSWWIWKIGGWMIFLVDEMCGHPPGCLMWVDSSTSRSPWYPKVSFLLLADHKDWYHLILALFQTSWNSWLLFAFCLLVSLNLSCWSVDSHHTFSVMIFQVSHFCLWNILILHSAPFPPSSNRRSVDIVVRYVCWGRSCLKGRDLFLTPSAWQTAMLFFIRIAWAWCLCCDVAA